LKKNLCQEHGPRSAPDAAATINQFVGGELDVSRIASAVDSSLHRNRQKILVEVAPGATDWPDVK
jgi:hypothetical protein